MSKRPNVVLVIVEGPTEELTLGLVFSQLFRAMGICILRSSTGIY